MENKIEELDLEAAETEKEIYLLVSYYGGNSPYVMLSEKLESASKYDIAYKVKIPYKQHQGE